MCKSCCRQFSDRKVIDSHRLWSDYVHGKQTLKQLSERYGISHDTITRRLNTIRPPRLVSSSKQVVVLMDATYWGWRFGVVVFKDIRIGKVLWRKFIRTKETLADYQEGVNWLEEHRFVIDGIVCDGLRGMFQLMNRYRVQLCQFHQIKIVRKYLTRRPELPASRELLELVKLMAHTDKESFEGAFGDWYERWSDFLKERSRDPVTGKSRYTHRNLRSAYLSIKRNMPYLWTWYDHLVIGIPNTNNALEGMFTDLKSKLRNHNGLSKERRKRFIDEYFRATFRCSLRG